MTVTAICPLAAAAFRSALARRGREIAAAGGPEALADMLARVRAADPARAAAREAILTAVWPGSAEART